MSELLQVRSSEALLQACIDLASLSGFNFLRSCLFDAIYDICNSMFESIGTTGEHMLSLDGRLSRHW